MRATDIEPTPCSGITVQDTQCQGNEVTRVRLPEISRAIDSFNVGWSLASFSRAVMIIS